MPSAAGRLLQREVAALSHLLVDPARPYVAVVGGAKAADKLGILRSLGERVDHLLLGGAMCFTFLAAQGHHVGASHLEPEFLNEARTLLSSHPAPELPNDLVGLSPGGVLGLGALPTGEVRHFGVDLPPGWQGADIGPRSRARFAETIGRASTVVWNGPMGVFEDDRFDSGTRAIAEAMASSLAFTVVGGGETAAALHAFGLEGRIDHISSGGGATLELIENGDLPGLAALRTSVTFGARHGAQAIEAHRRGE
jgi:phosphoglycerate kinase